MPRLGAAADLQSGSVGSLGSTVDDFCITNLPEDSNFRALGAGTGSFHPSESKLWSPRVCKGKEKASSGVC